MVWRPALILVLALVGASAQKAPTAEDCTRVGIVKALSAVKEISTVVSVIDKLKLAPLLPNQRGQGTLFLPKDTAFTALGVAPTELLTTLKNQTVSILLFHSLLGEATTYNRAALVKAKTITSDLGLVQAALGDMGDYNLTFAPGPNSKLGKEEVKGIRNFSQIRGVLKVCGYYVYPIDGVLIPASTVPEVPAGAGAAINAAIASGADLNTPDGLGAALKSGAVTLPAAAIAAGKAANKATPAPAPGAATSPRGTSINAADAAMAPGGADAMGPGGAAAMGPGGASVVGTEGSADSPAGAPGSAMAPADATSSVDGVAGAALPLNGTGGTLSSMEPVMLQGTVTSADGRRSLGPGLVYLDGTVQDGTGVDGTATVVNTLDSKGASLSSKSIPLMGADVTGLPFSAAGITVIGGMAMGPSAMGAGAMGPGGAMAAGAMAPGAMGAGGEMSPDGAPSGAQSDAPAGAPGSQGAFGTVLPGSKDMPGDLNFNGTTILDGTITGGKALTAAAATGEAAKGKLGPGGIFIDGKVKAGKGVSGKAYPIVALGEKNVIVNKDNGINIKGATVDGTGYSAKGIEPKLQAASGPGGAGVASAGSPGVTKPGQPSEPAAAAAGPGAAASPAGAASSASTAAVSIAALLSTIAAMCLVIA